MINQQVETALDKLKQANEIQAQIKKGREVLAQIKTADAVSISVPGVSSAYEPTIKFCKGTNNNGHTKGPADYATVYDFVAAQEAGFTKLAAVFVVECIKQGEKELEELEARLVALLA